MTITDRADRERVLSSTDRLVEALKSTPAVQRFAEASHRFETDPDVRSIVDVLQRFQRVQQSGGMSERELEAARDAQARFHGNEVVQFFIAAQGSVQSLLKEANRVVSETLGLDFAQTGDPAGGGC